MKKAVPYLLLTFAGLGPCVSFLTLSSHWSVTSKAISLILSSCVFSSVALMVLVWALRDTWSTTPRPDSSNRLATLAAKERLILARVGLQKEMTKTSESDLVTFNFSPVSEMKLIKDRFDIAQGWYFK